ncbi:TonB-dependent receptor [Porphyrobacter sp. YT40]|uniref:TonB-dependent receptor n=1 Tax=Porphyrobacter sp. YT40 TaxID=2547601 RepID=UPI00114217D2|nr:TonB-dependent receptor [Porphyrobacter sp. YT40]QDH34216.1 TonB-dependent receptor [Porphyrobacter sp. YT40]
MGRDLMRIAMQHRAVLAGSQTGWLKGALRAGASVLVVGSALSGQLVVAQDAEQPDPDVEDAVPAEDVSANEILVTGLRASLANAQNLKRNSDTVVDAITAQDIGALPDRSVTEALQRVPGIAINRFAGSNDPDHFSVEGSGVVVRGLNFVRSEFNGRSAFAAGVGGQALNFADVPAELLGSVVISKNATAETIEGGLAGTVNLITRKPFDNNGFKIALSAEANYGDFRKEWTPTISGLISNTWETDKGRFGLLASASYSRIKSRADGVQIANYQTRDGRLVSAANADGVQVCRNPLPGSTDNFTLPPAGSLCGVAGTPGADGFADYADSRVAPVGGQFRTQEFDRERNGIAISAQFESIDEKTLITAEFIRSASTNKWGEYTYETAPDLSEYQTYPIGCLQNADGPTRVNPDGTAGDPTPRAQCPVGGFTDFNYTDTGLFQSGYIVNASNGWRGDPGASPFVPIGGLQQSLARRQVNDEIANEDYSINLKTELTDRLSLRLDAQYATSRKQNLDFSVFGSTFADQELDISGNLPTIIPRKPQFLGYVWSTPGADLANATEEQYFNDPRFQFWRAAMDHIEDSTGKQYAFQADMAYEFDDDSFIRKAKWGARYQDRDQTVRYTTYNWGMLSETWSGSRPVNFADSAPELSERYDFPNFFRGRVPGPPGAFYYAGDLIGDYEGAIADFQGIQDQATALGASPSWVPLSGRQGAIAGTPYLPEDIQPIAQQDTAAYVQLDFGSDNVFGDLRLSGNIGLRYVNTRIRSQGSIGVPSQQALNILDPFDERCESVVPPGAPPGTPPSSPGGVCNLGPQGYAELQTFAGNGGSRLDVAEVDYSFWLPSLNLKLGITDDVIVRLAGSRVLTRPDNSYVRNFLQIGLGQSGELTANSGNPFIRPATAWQFDATVEWYFDTVGSLTFNAFYKDINDFFFQEITSREVTSNGITRDVLVRGPANFDDNGKIKGFELAYQQTYDFLPKPLDGLGVAANYTYIESSGLPNTFLNTGEPVDESTVPPGNLPLEQLSKHNVNATVFYEKGPISLRAAYNWRSRFLLTPADVIFPYYSIFNESTGQLDASIFFNVTDQIRVGVQGVNLLDEVTRTTQAYTGDPNVLAPRSFFMNDRRFSFIVRGNF